MPTVLQWAAPTWTDGDYTAASPVSLPVFNSPIAATTAGYVFKQDYEQFLANFTPAALNTAHPSSGKTPDYSAYFLVAEGERQDVGGGVVRWTRTYATVPASHDEFESTTYSFIGFWGITWPMISADTGLVAYAPAVGVPVGRLRFPEAVESRIVHEYFQVDSSSGVSTGPIYDTPGNIPIVQAQKYRMSVSGFQYWTDVEFLSDVVLSGSPYPTTPTREDYEGVWMQNARTLGWGSGRVIYEWIPGASGSPVGSPSIVDTSESNPGQICSQDSTLERWMGNIWLRKTRYILAQ